LDVVNKGVALWNAERLRACHLTATVARPAADVASLFPGQDVGASGKHVCRQGDPQLETNKTTLPRDKRKRQKQSGDYPGHLVLDLSNWTFNMAKNECLPLIRACDRGLSAAPTLVGSPAWTEKLRQPFSAKVLSSHECPWFATQSQPTTPDICPF
jgi:hypothetical protein